MALAFAFEGSSPIRNRTVKRKLHTGQTITLTPAEDKMLHAAYDHVQGYAERMQLGQVFNLKPYADRAQMMHALHLKLEEVQHLTAQNSYGGGSVKTRRSTLVTDGAGAKHHNAAAAVTQLAAQAQQQTNNSSGSGGNTNNDTAFAAVDPEAKLEEYKTLEDRITAHMTTDHKISFADIEAVMRDLSGGALPQKRIVDQMIWEVDEMADGVISWDEFQLAYYRCVNDTTSNEPSSFFRLLEFLTFDQTRKGYIIEDDCMEILFARIGGKHLERELRSIFGDRLRALGGDGTLSLEGYLVACLAKSGRRALLF